VKEFENDGFSWLLINFGGRRFKKVDKAVGREAHASSKAFFIAELRRTKNQGNIERKIIVNVGESQKLAPEDLEA
jgi:hypothetical protein